MRAYELKRGHAVRLEGGRLRDLGEEAFGSAVERGGRVRCSYGALEVLEAWVDGQSLFVQTTARPDSDDVAQETIRRYNAFLEKATGHTSKQRRSRIQRKAKEGKV